MPAKAYLDETASPVRPETLAEETRSGIMRREDRVARRLLDAAVAREIAIHRWLTSHSITALRISFGAVLLGFGILKYFPGVSPAQDLALATTHLLSFGLVPAVVPGTVAMALIATLECSIGLLLITGWWLRLTIALLAVQLSGILSPIVLLTGRLFAGPNHMPTLEGQYVLKDVILLTAAMVIATTVRRRHLHDSGDGIDKKAGQQ